MVELIGGRLTRMLTLIAFVLGLVGIWADWPWQVWVTLLVSALYTEIALHD